MIGKLVRHKYDAKIGVVLRREIARRGNFRYHVFMDGKIRTILLSWLEVINE